jgi:UDP-GlcNAc:undecaprenyl-phosphate GlcNAc-1-phosphate transferase
MLGGVLIFLLGLWDDFADIKPRVKLLGQIMVALVIVALNVRITLFIPHFFLSTIITVLWIVVIINAFNLLDNMDGLCAGVAIIASAVFWGVSVSQGNYFIALLLALLIGALAGFLRYNFHPARIFMGDAGSMLIGYFVAVLTIMQTYYNEGKAESLAVLMPLVILAVPLYDTASVVLIRIVRGESIFKADRRHFSHRLVDLGMTQWGAVLFIYLVTLCTGLSATLLRRVGWMGGTVILVQTFFIVLIIALLEYYGGKRIAK